jgi:hypothetical protein
MVREPYVSGLPASGKQEVFVPVITSALAGTIENIMLWIAREIRRTAFRISLIVLMERSSCANCFQQIIIEIVSNCFPAG